MTCRTAVSRLPVLLVLLLALACLVGCDEPPAPAQSARAWDGLSAITMEIVAPPKPKAEGVYAAWAVCLNCSWKGAVEAPLGEPLKSAQCPNCQCSDLVSFALFEIQKGERCIGSGAEWAE